VAFFIYRDVKYADFAGAKIGDVDRDVKYADFAGAKIGDADRDVKYADFAGATIGDGGGRQVWWRGGSGPVGIL